MPRSHSPLGRACCSPSSESVIKMWLWLGQRGSCPSLCCSGWWDCVGWPGTQVLPGEGSGTQEAEDETCRVCGGLGPG